jgi:hypothetical protein
VNGDECDEMVSDEWRVRMVGCGNTTKVKV